MNHTEAQGKAIRLSSGDVMAEKREHMDKEGKVHVCENCGSAVKCDENETEEIK